MKHLNWRTEDARSLRCSQPRSVSLLWSLALPRAIFPATFATRLHCFTAFVASVDATSDSDDIAPLDACLSIRFFPG